MQFTNTRGLAKNVWEEAGVIGDTNGGYPTVSGVYLTDDYLDGRRDIERATIDEEGNVSWEMVAEAVEELADIEPGVIIGDDFFEFGAGLHQLDDPDGDGSYMDKDGRILLNGTDISEYAGWSAVSEGGEVIWAY